MALEESLLGPDWSNFSANQRKNISQDEVRSVVLQLTQFRTQNSIHQTSLLSSFFPPTFLPYFLSFFLLIPLSVSFLPQVFLFLGRETRWSLTTPIFEEAGGRVLAPKNPRHGTDCFFRGSDIEREKKFGLYKKRKREDFE